MKNRHMSLQAGCMALLLLLVPTLAKACDNNSVHIVNTNAGRLLTAHASEYENRIYVGGLAIRPSSPAIGSHVHVWGVDKNDRLVFSKTTSVLFTGKPSFTHSASFVLSLSPNTYAKACKVYATFHSLADHDQS